MTLRGLSQEDRIIWLILHRKRVESHPSVLFAFSHLTETLRSRACAFSACPFMRTSPPYLCVSVHLCFLLSSNVQR